MHQVDRISVTQVVVTKLALLVEYEPKLPRALLRSSVLTDDKRLNSSVAWMAGPQPRDTLHSNFYVHSCL